MKQVDQDWVEIHRDRETQIETIRAHFNGHAYEPHWHDSFLVGFTEQGVQQFKCGKQKHLSTPGNIFLLEPGDIHDGDAPYEDGFTYQMLYLDPVWIKDELVKINQDIPINTTLQFRENLIQDTRLIRSIAHAFHAIHRQEMKITKDAAISDLLILLSHTASWESSKPIAVSMVERAKDFIHEHATFDIGMDDIAHAIGTDRFQMARQFKSVFGISTHAYLVQLRLSLARKQISQGQPISDVAAMYCFSDQSHLGRWFKRSYKISPAAYQKACTNLPDF